jgi:hypothetical protein
LALALTAGLLALATLRVARVGWVPAVEQAIAALPKQARIDDGRLIWPSARREVLADNQWLAFVVSPAARDPSVQAADVQVELTANVCWISGLLGYWWLPYPTGYIIDLNRETVESLWAAWRPHLQAGVFLAGGLLPLGIVALIALLLGWSVKGYAWLLGRTTGWTTVWRLAVVAQVPGAWLWALGLVLYSFRALTPSLLLGVAALAGVLTLLFLLLAPWWLPRKADEDEAEEDNPFAEDEEEAGELDPDNPFGGGG